MTKTKNKDEGLPIAKMIELLDRLEGLQGNDPSRAQRDLTKKLTTNCERMMADERDLWDGIATISEFLNSCMTTFSHMVVSTALNVSELNEYEAEKRSKLFEKIIASLCAEMNDCERSYYKPQGKNYFIIQSLSSELDFRRFEEDEPTET